MDVFKEINVSSNKTLKYNEMHYKFFWGEHLIRHDAIVYFIRFRLFRE